MATDRVVIAGTSIGGIRTAQALRADGYQGEIVMIGAESVDPYDKPPLSKQFLSGEDDLSDIALLGSSGWAGIEAVPLLGRAAASLDVARKELVLSDNERVSYDHLVIATGARARTLLDPNGSPVAQTIRYPQDAVALRERITRGGGPVVVVGGGFVGAEVASTASQLGAETTIVEAMPVPFSRVLGPEVGEILAALHQDNAVKVIAGVGVDSVVPGADDTSLVRLANGTTLEAAAVVAGIGVIPNSEWLEGSGVSVRDGVVCDEYCAVDGAPDVYAIGDVARWRHLPTGEYRRVEHWTNAVDQASTVAHNILHASEKKAYVAAPYFWSDQHGTKIQMVGDISPTDHVELHTLRVLATDRRIAVYSQNGRLTAGVALGWPRGMVLMRKLWERNASAAEAVAELEMLAHNAVRARVVPA
jgi:NADPH-dependent 2,4-dienoyl-CoA reductase/sulfur reductase-like enzyme